MIKINPDRIAVKELFQLPESKPIYLLNMVKFRLKTEDGKSGREKYNEYKEALKPLQKIVKAETVWSGNFAKNLLGDKDWDLIYVTKYPSPRSFLQMITSKEYQEIIPIRESAIEYAELIASHDID